MSLRREKEERKQSRYVWGWVIENVSLLLVFLPLESVFFVNVLIIEGVKPKTINKWMDGERIRVIHKRIQDSLPFFHPSIFLLLLYTHRTHTFSQTLPWVFPIVRNSRRWQFQKKLISGYFRLSGISVNVIFRSEIYVCLSYLLFLIGTSHIHEFLTSRPLQFLDWSGKKVVEQNDWVISSVIFIALSCDKKNDFEIAGLKSSRS